jgi:prepilin-type N-terminal cleavage/methylation domain-containing protein
MMTADDAPRARKRAGFSMIEMMLALTILAGGLLAMLTAQVSALKQGKYGRHATEAAQVARDQMEYLLRLPWAAAAVQPTNWTVATPVSLTFQDEAGAVQQQVFNVSWRIQVAAFSTDIRSIDVRVLWTEAEATAGLATRRYVLSSNKNNG